MCFNIYIYNVVCVCEYGCMCIKIYQECVCKLKIFEKLRISVCICKLKNIYFIRVCVWINKWKRKLKSVCVYVRIRVCVRQAIECV